MGYRYNPFSGELDRVDTTTVPPSFPDTFVADTGSAVPAAFIVNLLGDATQGLITSASGNTVTFTNDDATESQKGVLELSTDAESIAGTVTDVAVVPTSLKAKLGSQTQYGVSYGDTDSNALQWTSAGTAGQLVIAATGAAPAFASLTSTGGTVTFTPGPNTLNLEAGGAVATTYTTDSGNATPAANVLNVLGGGSTTSTGAGNTVTVVLTGMTNHSVLVGAGTTTLTKVGPDAATGIPLISQGASADPIFGTAVVAGGGTGATSFTTGSVIFMGASTLAEDNSNFFWDDTNNRLGLGITTPLDPFHVVGAMELDHTAAEADDHALEIVCDTAGFGDVKAIDIDYITGALSAGDDEEVILVNIDESSSTGGTISGYQVLTTSEGSASVNGYVTGINISPILHNSGTFGDIDDILNKAVDVTASLASGGAGNITTFVADNDTMTFGDAAKWNEMEFIVDTPASGSGIAPTFEFSTGGAGFTAFVPSDGTNGLRNTGTILWVTADLTGWATNASGLFEIRMTRTRNSLSTVPILDEVQLSATTEFIWDLNGDVNINSLTLVTDLTVPNGGTGASTFTDGGILLGSGTGAITATAQPTNGQVLVGSTGVDPVLATLTAGAGIAITNGAGSITITSNDGGMAWTEVTVTGPTAMAVDNGYIANNAALVTLTLPAVAVVGDVVKVDGSGAGGWLIAQNAGQTVHFLGQDTTTGAGGSLASTTQYDCVTYRCIVANTDWVVESAVGNLTVV
jgi:hypothetical protein